MHSLLFQHYHHSGKLIIKLKNNYKRISVGKLAPRAKIDFAESNSQTFKLGFQKMRFHQS